MDYKTADEKLPRNYALTKKITEEKLVRRRDCARSRFLQGIISAAPPTAAVVECHYVKAGPSECLCKIQVLFTSGNAMEKENGRMGTFASC